MPSALVYKANEITQVISDIQLTLYPLRWSTKELKWLYGSKCSWIRFVTISVIWKVLLFKPIVLFALNQLMFGSVGRPNIMQITTSIFFVILLWGSLFLDIIFWLYGQEAAACCNWCYKMEDIMSTQKMDSITTSKDYGKANSKIGQAINLFKTDLLGVLLTSFAASLPLVLIQIVLITIELKVEPFIVYVSLTRVHFKELLGIVQMVRILLLLLMSQWLLTSFRVIIPIFLGMTTLFLRCVKALQFRNVTHKSVHLYKQLVVQRNILWNFERDLTSMGLVGLFFILVVSMAQLIISLSDKKIAMFAIAALVFGVANSTLYVSFHMCCSVNEMSIEILNIWRSKCGSGTHYQFLRRLLWSNRPLYVPVGDIGIMDRDLKLNYYSAVTDYTVNVLLAVQ